MPAGRPGKTGKEQQQISAGKRETYNVRDAARVRQRTAGRLLQQSVTRVDRGRQNIRRDERTGKVVDRNRRSRVAIGGNG